MHASRHFSTLALLLTLVSPALAQNIDCATIGTEVQASDVTAYSARDASLVWTGSGYGVAWTDYRNSRREIYFARLDASGTKIGPDVRVTNVAAHSTVPSLAWTGSEYGVAWSDYRDSKWEVYFARLDSAGAKIGDDIRFTNSERAQDPSLVWSGTEYGLAWEQRRSGQYRVNFQRLDSSGNGLGDAIEVNLPYPGSSYDPSLVWTGSEYGLAYTASATGAINFTRIDAAGTKILDPFPITDGDGFPRYPSLAWTGSGYGIAFSCARGGDYETWITRLDASGDLIGEDVEVVHNTATSLLPSLVWLGTEFGLSWDDNDAGAYNIFFANLDSTGNDIGDHVKVTDTTGRSGRPSMVRDDGGYAVAWQDDRNAGSIYFARVQCGCLAGPDPDNDGVGMPCDNCAATPNPDQDDLDRDGVGDACDACTDSDYDGFGDPGYPNDLCLTDNCADIPNPNQIDIDEDDWGALCDCNDGDDRINPGHPEYNDGLDNDCDVVVDEGSDHAGFCCDDGDPAVCTRRFCWPWQVGASEMQVGRSDSRHFIGDCAWDYVTEAFWEDPGDPDPDVTFYYLHRPSVPLEGSWGPLPRWPYERDPPCLP